MSTKILRAALLWVAAFFFAQNSYALPTANGPISIVHITGDVGLEMMGNIQAVRKSLAVVPANKTVKVLIFSNGGSVTAMTSIIGELHQIKKMGYKLNCLAVQAWSAAFMIWMECDKRYVLPDSSVMFHYPYRAVHYNVSLEEAEAIASDLRTWRVGFNLLFAKHLMPHMSPALLEKSAIDSRMWQGYEFCFDKPGFCKILRNVNNLEGLDND